MYFETIRTPSSALCPFGLVLTVSEVAQLTEQNAAGIRACSVGADAVRFEGFAFKVLNSLEEAGNVSREDMAFAFAGEGGAHPYFEVEEVGYPPTVDLEELLNECDDEESESGRDVH
ncbi:hypothetical protein [Roseimicrobium sp. ORNL1]|uniref:hypothetical protein n=1 Tax=Roseimicrobium sp. ORNL1 TaxID=2711231 RepID=UPI0013E13579|nr:hypothetical protein [Roseimicrobium sp. ORNL1]QIF02873.1 hypothetical protein G5S37_15545 [Roseimicrobium sp. ORNL1]